MTQKIIGVKPEKRFSRPHSSKFSGYFSVVFFYIENDLNIIVLSVNRVVERLGNHVEAGVDLLFERERETKVEIY